MPGSVGRMTEMTPPGRTTRAHSLSALYGSGMCSRTWVATSLSNDPSGNVSFSPFCTEVLISRSANLPEFFDPVAGHGEHGLVRVGQGCVAAKPAHVEDVVARPHAHFEDVVEVALGQGLFQQFVAPLEDHAAQPLGGDVGIASGEELPEILFLWIVREIHVNRAPVRGKGSATGRPSHGRPMRCGAAPPGETDQPVARVTIGYTISTGLNSGRASPELTVNLPRHL